MITPKRRLATAVLVAASAAGILAGCGDDDDSAGDGTTTTAATDDLTTRGGDAATGIAASCDAYGQITMAFSSDEPDPGAIEELVTTLEREAPDEIAEPLGVMTSAVDSVLASNGEDFSAFEAPEFTEAQSEVDPYMFENCEFDASYEVVAKDYSFEGLPDEVDAGQVAILLENQGTEAHEIAIMRKQDGVTESFAEILELPEEEAMAKVEMVGGAFAAMNGSTGMLIGDFAPGEYIAVCFIPVGTTVTETGETEGDGPPHFMEGMQKEFTVS
jgi:hypothetical protein